MININKYTLFSYSFIPHSFCKMDAFLLTGCDCDVEQGYLKAFKNESNQCTKNNLTTTSTPKTTHKSYRTPLADRTRSPKKVPPKPRKNKNGRPDFRLTTGANVVRALTFD